MQFTVTLPNPADAARLADFVHELGGKVLPEKVWDDPNETPEAAEKRHQFEQHPRFREAILRAQANVRETGGIPFEVVMAELKAKFG